MFMVSSRYDLLGSYLAVQNWNCGGARPKVTSSTATDSMNFQGARVANLRSTCKGDRLAHAGYGLWSWPSRKAPNRAPVEQEATRAA